MNTNRLTQLDDASLLRSLDRIVAQDRAVTAELLAHLAEVDARRLYLEAACPSMHAYLVQRLHFSDGAAYKRIHAARAARRFPRLLRDVGEGRLNLGAVTTLAPHLTPGNVDEFVAAAVHLTSRQLEVWLAERLAPSVSPGVAPIRARIDVVRPRTRSASSPAGPSPTLADQLLGLLTTASSDGAPESPEPEGGEALMQSTPVSAPAPVRYVVHVPIDQATHSVLREVQDLLGSSAAGGDLAEVFRRALASLRKELLRRKAGQVAHPRGEVSGRTSPRSRVVPAHVRRVVWARDGGRCTFTSFDGVRCEARRALEFDHVTPFARGGESTADGLRLRCRGHTQLEADRAFGTGFMRERRQRGRGRGQGAGAAGRNRGGTSHVGS